MKEYEKLNPLNKIYDEENIEEVSKQITDAYNSGVIDQENSEMVERENKKQNH